MACPFYLKMSNSYYVHLQFVDGQLIYVDQYDYGSRASPLSEWEAGQIYISKAELIRSDMNVIL